MPTNEEFKIDSWTILVTQSHILPSKCSKGCNETTEDSSLCSYCKYTKCVPLPHLPEMVFPDNTLNLQHKCGFSINFNALDALNRVSTDQPSIKVACSAEWIEARANSGLTANLKNPFDWTFSTDYSGTLTGECETDANTSMRINMQKLAVREPLLFYKELILYEDELHDKGASLLSLKIRCMPSGFLVLLRFYLRVDDILIKVNDTRYHYEHEKDYILKETLWREIKFEGIKSDELRVKLFNAENPSGLEEMNVLFQATEKICPLPREVDSHRMNKPSN